MIDLSKLDAVQSKPWDLRRERKYAHKQHKSNRWRWTKEDNSLFQSHRKYHNLFIGAEYFDTFEKVL